MFSPVQNKRVYQQVAEQVQEMILSGALRPGDRLPSERAMAAEFGVSRNSVREAVRAMEMLGFVETRQGGGNFIVAGGEGRLFEPLSIMFKLRGGSFSDLLETRRGLEVEAASLAARRITREGARRLEAAMAEFRAAEDDGRAMELDKRLHFLIAELSGNQMLTVVLGAVSRLIEEAVRDGRRMIIKSSGDAARLEATHQELCDAIAAGKPEAAAAACQKHFELILENLGK